MHRPLSLVCAAACAALLPAAAALAQAAAAPPGEAASAPRPAPQKVEITATGAAADEGVAERRRAIAGRITIGREELDRMGDQTLGEVLKRLPGVSMGGPPGRGGGGIRMRGMGGGYTQILIDGQRMPPGFSLESIAPEQIERIEILRAPIAEHGARAIAGTINVILRSDFRRKANELRFGAGTDGGRPQAGATLQRNGQSDALGWNLTATVFDNHQGSEVDTTTLHTAPDGSTELLQRLHNESRSHGRGIFSNARLAWKLGGGDSLELQPFFNLVRSRSEGFGRLVQDTPAIDPSRPDTVPAYTASDWTSRSQWTMGRLMGVGNIGTGAGGRITTRFGTTLSRSESHTVRAEDGGPQHNDKLSDSATRDFSIDWNGKYSQLLADSHSASVGWELQYNQRSDTTSALLNGAADPSDVDFGATLTARIRRAALYAQDEWEWSKQLSFYVGARWEGIETLGDSSNATDGTLAVDNRSGVLTPLAHLVWKFADAEGKPGRDQLRASLTRSYRSPNTNQMIGRRQISSLAPVGADRKGTNSADRPDRQGNPELKPELAWGLELGLEHYTEGSGLLSANLYARRIDNVIRNLTTLQTVAYADVRRYVQQPTNLGTATTWGIELEAKLRASDLWATELPLSLRANASWMWSHIDGVPGPDNRLEGQPPYALNLGADLPLRGTPLTLGGNLNYTPGFRVQLFDDNAQQQGVKRQLDAYALWRFTPDASARLTITNAAPRGYDTGAVYTLPSGAAQGSTVATRTFTVINLRAELRF